MILDTKMRTCMLKAVSWRVSRNIAGSDQRDSCANSRWNWLFLEIWLFSVFQHPRFSTFIQCILCINRIDPWAKNKDGPCEEALAIARLNQAILI